MAARRIFFANRFPSAFHSFRSYLEIQYKRRVQNNCITDFFIAQNNDKKVLTSTNEEPRRDHSWQHSLHRKIPIVFMVGGLIAANDDNPETFPDTLATPSKCLPFGIKQGILRRKKEWKTNPSID